MVTPTVAISNVWYWLYAQDYGLINITLYELFGIQGPGWLTTMEVVQARHRANDGLAWYRLHLHHISGGLEGIRRITTKLPSRRRGRVDEVLQNHGAYAFACHLLCDGNQHHQRLRYL